MVRMIVTFDNQDGVCILRLQGRFATGQDTDYLREKTEELKKQGCTRIIADFSDVSYIDSTGIGFLIAIYASISRDGHGKFALAGANRRVREVLTLTKLNTIFSTYETLADAVTALK